MVADIMLVISAPVPHGPSSGTSLRERHAEVWTRIAHLVGPLARCRTALELIHCFNAPWNNYVYWISRRISAIEHRAILIDHDAV